MGHDIIQFIKVLNYSVNLEQIVDLNYNKLQDMKNLYYFGLLTDLGRITVIKTMIIPKLTHLFIFLRNPNETLIKTINTIFEKKILQNKPDKMER